MSIKSDNSSGTTAKGRFEWMPKVEVLEEPEPAGAHTQRVLLTLKYSDVDEYHADALKRIASSLPELIKAVRNEEFDTRVSQMIKAYRPTDPLADVHMSVIENGLVMKHQLVRDHAMLNARSIEAIAKQDAVAGSDLVNTWLKEKKIFSVDYHGIQLFPAFQFHDGLPIPIVEKLLSVFEKENYSAWSIAAWLTYPTGWLNEARPIDLLLTKPDQVLDAAEQYVSPEY